MTNPTRSRKSNARSTRPVLPPIAQRRAAIWPRRNQPGLSRSVFQQAFATARRAPPAPPKKPDGLIGVIEAALRLCRAVGLPELWKREAGVELPKASTLLELEDTTRGLVVRLIHRVHHSKQRLEEAADALCDLMAAMGRDVRFREVGHAPNMGGWQAVLRLSPSIGRPVPAMVR